MLGKLDPEDNVMDGGIISKRKAIAVCNQGVVQELYDTIAKLGWDCYDNVTVEIGGTQVSVLMLVKSTTKSGNHQLALVSTIKMLSSLSRIKIVET